MNRKLERLVQEGAKLFEEFEFLQSVDTDSFCEHYKIIQLPSSRSILSLVFGLDGIGFFKEQYPEYWDVGVGITKYIHQYLHAHPNIESIIDWVQEYNVNEDVDFDYHGEAAEDSYINDNYDGNGVREHLKNFYNIQDKSLEKFIWSATLMVCTMFQTIYDDEMFNDDNCWRIIMEYSSLVDLIAFNK